MDRNMPTDVSNFGTIEKDGLLYIDKTFFIEKLESLAYYASFFRPRRFGKTLFVTTLEHYYDYKAKKDFDSLFGNTYIGVHPTPLRNSFAVLKFDFSGLSAQSESKLYTEFSERVGNSIENFIKCNKIPLEEPLDFNRSPGSLMDQFLNRANFSYPLYILIDEYDNFANLSLGSNNINLLSSSIAADGFVRNFYSVLKIATSKLPGMRIFMTGVSPISLDSLTSGFNITDNLTLDPEFHDMMGFTSEEINELINFILPNISDSERELIIKDLVEQYDGYRFSPDIETKLFNSSMTLYYLKKYASLRKPPRAFLDPNIRSSFTKVHSLASVDLGEILNADLEQRVEAKEKRIDSLLSIISGEKQSVDLTTSYELFKMTNDDFISMLFYLGYLTIDGLDGEKTILSIPNQVIKSLFIDYFKNFAVPSMGMDFKKAEMALMQLS
jgi:hypothetical protein